MLKPGAGKPSGRECVFLPSLPVWSFTGFAVVEITQDQGGAVQILTNDRHGYRKRLGIDP
jgi:hypothetical protein